ncbi:MAG TPA: AAA family ATPase [Micromonosporaceae bacterium]|nr:AAA family ATPase [Micromonosporaceae bacterium]
MAKILLSLDVENFRSLRNVSLPLGRLNVLVGPNGAGKTNLLEVFRFLADVIRTDLEPALELRGGFDQLVFRGGYRPSTVDLRKYVPSVRIKLTATWTTYSSPRAPDPEPPALTCVEEIDHGLHPQALELLVERLREASQRTQFLIATHSPEVADRLKPEELVVCERRDDGSSVIPAVSTERVRQIVAESEGLPLGDLWFSGALGGDL